MPTYIDNTDAPCFFYWSPGQHEQETPVSERNDQLARAVAEQCSVEEIQQRDNRHE